MTNTITYKASSTSTERVEVLGEDSSATFDDSNRMLTLGGEALSYDANGNLSDKGDMELSWDQKNRLVGVLNAPGGDVTYTYDAFSRRVSKAIDGTTTRKYLYDGWDIVEEQDGSGALVARYIRTMNIDEPLARVDSSGNELYYLRDILGSVIALVNSSGDVVTRYNYSPFGDTDVSGVDVDQPFRFTGREWDAETGMYHYRLRTLATDMGRFISEDPLRFAAGDVNFYRYVGNDPANWIDPLGLNPFSNMSTVGKGGQVSHSSLMPPTGARMYWTGLFPGVGRGRGFRDWHYKRNILQQGMCPETEPDDDSPECKEGGWEKFSDNSMTHGGYKDYRGTGGNRGYQCVYDDDRNLVTDPRFSGTYDYFSPQDAWIRHILFDLVPFALFGN